MRAVLISLVTAVLLLVIIGITLSIGAEIQQDVREDFEANGTSYNASTYAIGALANLAEWQGTISTVIAAVVIIGLLLAGFGAFIMAGGNM